MPSDAIGGSRGGYPKSKYSEVLLLIAGSEVLFAWTFLVLVGLFPGNAFSSLAPVSAVVGFIIAGLGILEYGVIVVNVQLAWILPDDHDESGVAPFLCGYCLLGQVLLMFPPLIIVAIVAVPLVLISVACVGWYFQKFTSLKLSKPDRLSYQHPLSLKALLWMPVCVLGMGVIPLLLPLFFGPYFFELAITHGKHLGVIVICSSIGMISFSFLPLLACYGFLYLSRCARSMQILAIAVVILSLFTAISIEAIASNFTSAIMPLVSLAIVMFVSGLWVGLNPWRRDGLHVVIAKPMSKSPTISEVRFDDVQ